MSIRTIAVAAALGCHATGTPSTPMPDLGGGVNGRDPRCPASAPASGSACDLAGGGALDCEYGGDSLARNTTLAACATRGGASSATWLVGADNLVGPNPAACPSCFAAAMQSGSCAADVNLACDYDEGRCG